MQRHSVCPKPLVFGKYKRKQLTFGKQFRHVKLICTFLVDQFLLFRQTAPGTGDCTDRQGLLRQK